MDILIQIGLAIQFILILIIYFHNAAFYKSMSRSVVQIASMVSSSKKELDLLTRFSHEQFRSANTKQLQSLISDFLKMLGYDNFSVAQIENVFFINIYDFTTETLNDIQLEYLYSLVNATLKIAYFKPGEDKFSHIQIIPEDSE